MTQRGKQDANPSSRFKPSKGPVVFPGRPAPGETSVEGNLALQYSLMEIFDEFSQVISGELKSLGPEAFEAERNANPTDKP